MSKPTESLLTFPCLFPVKVMGKNSDTFEAEMFKIARRHVPRLSEGAVQSRPSRNGNYLSITITFTAESRAQLDGLYSELSAHESVAMVL